jgi:hypothetical protein
MDRVKLALELSSTTEVLENIQLDKMPHVHTTMWEALQITKMATIVGDGDQNRDGDEPQGTTQKLTPHHKSLV